MKTILVTAIIIMLAASVNAQTGMPQNLTCTEQAINFSVSLGAKWKFSAPKMGPVEAKNYETDLMPAWSFKISQLASKTDLLPLFRALSNMAESPFAIHQQNYGMQFYPVHFNAADKPGYISPIINFGSSLNYMVLPPLIIHGN